MGLTRLLGFIDLICSIVMLTYPALFAELMYPQLTPYGVILAIKLLGWGHLGRGLCVLSIPRHELKCVAGWLWISTVPLHCAALHLWPSSVYTISWHGSLLMLAALASRSLYTHPYHSSRDS